MVASSLKARLCKCFGQAVIGLCLGLVAPDESPISEHSSASVSGAKVDIEGQDDFLRELVAVNTCSEATSSESWSCAVDSGLSPLLTAFNDSGALPAAHGTRLTAYQPGRDVTAFEALNIGMHAIGVLVLRV